jgi:hypothetical protein
MSDFLLGADNDLAVSDAGDLIVIDSRAVLAAQICEIRLKTYKGEWFLDQEEGIPYLQELLTSKADTLLIDLTIKAATLATPDITSIETYRAELDNSTQIYSIFMTARVTGGTVIPITLEV